MIIGQVSNAGHKKVWKHEGISQAFNFRLKQFLSGNRVIFYPYQRTLILIK